MPLHEKKTPSASLLHFPRRDHEVFQRRIASSGLGVEETETFREIWGLLLYSIGRHDPSAFKLRTTERLNPKTLQYFITDHCAVLSPEERIRMIYLLRRCAARMAPKNRFEFVREAMASEPRTSGAGARTQGARS